jgi:hypothetical protein
MISRQFRVMHRFSMWLLVLATVLAATMAAAVDPPKPDGKDTKADAKRDAKSDAKTDSKAAPKTEAASAAEPTFTRGLAPTSDGKPVPQNWLPPGAPSDDPGPSDVVFPLQELNLRFNHKFHVVEQKQPCKSCHGGAFTSESVADSLIPNGETCDTCHGTDHSDLSKVTPGDEASGQCNWCHLGYKAEDGNAVRKMSIPRPNMVFNHKVHVSRNIACQHCHGEIQELELATRDQMPRMAGCFRCHQMPDAASRGKATSACETCHVRAEPGTKVMGNPANGTGGRIQTLFASGMLKPPRWLHQAGHTPDWIERHKMVAANDSQFCANCHKEDYCVGCHDGRIRPRSVHPNDYISMHPIEARQATQRCTSCHREQSFCLTCHQRVGVSMSGPPGVRMSGRYHPPKEIWSDAPRKPGHHSFEAERNLNACIACHTERDCVVCHGGQGIGGGFDPHKSGFAGGCGAQMRRNPRPCFVCHSPSDSVLSQCR